MLVGSERKASCGLVLSVFDLSPNAIRNYVSLTTFSRKTTDAGGGSCCRETAGWERPRRASIPIIETRRVGQRVL